MWWSVTDPYPIPWTWVHGAGTFAYIWLIFTMVNVGKYTSPMDAMGIGSEDVEIVSHLLS